MPRLIRNILLTALITTMLLLNACKPTRVLTEYRVSDSTIVHEHLRDTSVHIAADTASIQLLATIENLPVETDFKPVFKAVSTTIKSNRASVKLQIKESGEIQATAVCDSLEIVVQVKDQIITNYRHEVAVYQEKEKKFFHIIRQIKRGAVALVLVIGLLFTYKLLKIFIKLFKL